MVKVDINLTNNTKWATFEFTYRDKILAQKSNIGPFFWKESLHDYYLNYLFNNKHN